jgi:glycosyltransferase involved in cell wall biosynthesis
MNSMQLKDKLKNISKEKKVDFKMLFVGGGFDYDKLVEYSKAKGIYDNCIFTGNVKDRELLQAYYLRGDLLLFPSTFDMASIVQVEASAHKTPAVVVENTCSAEQITDGENGFICKETALSYAEKLEFLSANPELVKTVGENAYKTLYRTWDDVGKEIKQAYKEIIQQYKNKK